VGGYCYSHRHPVERRLIDPLEGSVGIFFTSVWVVIVCSLGLRHFGGVGTKNKKISNLPPTLLKMILAIVCLQRVVRDGFLFHLPVGVGGGKVPAHILLQHFLAGWHIYELIQECLVLKTLAAFSIITYDSNFSILFWPARQRKVDVY